MRATTGPVTRSRGAPTATVMRFGGLRVAVGQAVITPRPWTVAQSRWGAELLDDLPAGRLLELCSGCGVIGLEAARLSGRSAVLVDASPEACRWAVRNCRVNGLAGRVEIRCAPLEAALDATERFPLVLADPPYVPSDAVGQHPEDPVTAIDGGPDGLDVVRAVLRAAARHLVPGGALLLQVRGPGQAAQVASLVERRGERSWRMPSVEVIDRHRAIALLTPPTPLTPPVPPL